MKPVHSFAPIADRNAEILILGSMPGEASLAAGEYYAHPQNAFWRIICDLLALDAAATYAARVAALKAARIALWDVLQSCVREGSLDAKIRTGSQKPNDFRSFFKTHRKIARVFFNGATAEASFKKLVQPVIAPDALLYARLPSTSPAHAAMAYAQKLGAWRKLLQSGAASCRAPVDVT
ncbi:MAG: DNA-deoxyinosine glycosylase [Betaproteobacteria bacterium]|nr:DNA-deoxyinosine glycosylase [Betaproteobacteria bacterium]